MFEVAGLKKMNRGAVLVTDCKLTIVLLTYVFLLPTEMDLSSCIHSKLAYSIFDRFDNVNNNLPIIRVTGQWICCQMLNQKIMFALVALVNKHNCGCVFVIGKITFDIFDK